MSGLTMVHARRDGRRLSSRKSGAEGCASGETKLHAVRLTRSPEATPNARPAEREPYCKQATTEQRQSTRFGNRLDASFSNPILSRSLRTIVDTDPLYRAETPGQYRVG